MTIKIDFINKNSSGTNEWQKVFHYLMNEFMCRGDGNESVKMFDFGQRADREAMCKTRRSTIIYVLDWMPWLHNRPPLAAAEIILHSHIKSNNFRENAK